MCFIWLFGQYSIWSFAYLYLTLKTSFKGNFVYVDIFLCKQDILNIRMILIIQVIESTIVSLFWQFNKIGTVIHIEVPD